MADREFLVRLTRELADQGKLIEAGWVAMRAHALPLNAPAVQIEEMKRAFMGGAQHVFASIIGMLDDDHEPTEADMNRMTLLHNELKSWEKQLELWVTKGKGNG